MADEPAKRKNRTASVISEAFKNSRVSSLLSASSIFRFRSSNNKRAPFSHSLQVGDQCETISIVTVREDESLDSDVSIELRHGTPFHILEVGEQPRRVKIQAGSITGWISVQTRLAEFLVAERPQNLVAAISGFKVGGHHEVIFGIPLSAGESLDSDTIMELKAGTVVRIKGTGQINNRRVWVETEVAAGWIDLTTLQGKPLIGKAQNGEQGPPDGGLFGTSKFKVMFESARCGDLATMQQIVEGNSGFMGKQPGRLNLNSRDVRGRSALMHASAFGNKHVVDYLLTQGHEVDVNGMDDARKSAVHHASKRTRKMRGELGDNQQVEIIKALVHARVDLSRRDIRGRTALMHASAFGNKNVVDYLLTKPDQVHVNGMDGTRKSALHHASKRTRKVRGEVGDNQQGEIIKALLHADAIVESKDSNGCTPLMLSLACGDEASVRVLLDVGACVNVKDYDSRTPLDYANNFGYYDLAALLKDCGAEGEDSDACQSIIQSNIIYAAEVSRVSAEEIQVCCNSMAGELLDTWSFANGASLMELKDQIVKNRLVDDKCQELGMKHLGAIFLLDDGTWVQMNRHIADFQRLTLKIQEAFTVGGVYAEDSEVSEDDAEEVPSQGWACPAGCSRFYFLK